MAGHAGDELVEGLGVEVLEDGPLAFPPGFVQGAGRTFAAGPILHNAAVDNEGPFDHLHGFAKRDLPGGSRQLGAPSASLFALD